MITAEQADTGQNVSAGQAVYNLAWSGDIDVLCDVPENALRGFALGQSARVTLAALPGRTFTASVRELSPAADAQSRTWRARLTLNDPGADVRLGMTADVTPLAADGIAGAAGAPQAHGIFTLPVTALFHQGREPAVWVVRAADNTLELRPVSIVRYNERTIQIGAGLKDGERVVLQGVHTVSAGEKVNAVAPLHPEDFAS